ncbi:MAG: NTP transferase domain-containing protein [Candidatus Lokiarchaeota archaeon]|nr:NTP transferase domain-containing protein [Candidatus Lokiarchaeota archaeon]
MMTMPDTLESIMADLKERINTEDKTTEVTADEVEAAKHNTVVVMPAGGKGTRIRGETGGDINKVMIRVGEESMIERAIREYSEIGIDKFVVLTGYLAEAVEDHLGDGSRWGVDIKYSKDPGGRKVGNAGAILHALQNDTLDENLTSIVHNPDDMIIGMDRPYGEVFLEGQIKARKNGCIATFIVVPETPFQYSGMIIDDGKVQDITKYPPITVPAHTGITVFDPEVYDYFYEHVSLEVESSFENVICPKIAREGRLFAINIPSEHWIPVNNLKGLEKAEAAMEET